MSETPLTPPRRHSALPCVGCLFALIALLFGFAWFGWSAWRKGQEVFAPRPISLEEISARAKLPVPEGAQLLESSYYGRIGMAGPTFYAKIGLEPDTVRQFEEAFESGTGEKFLEGRVRDMAAAERPVAWWPPADQKARVAVHFDERYSVRVAVVSSARHEALVYVLWRESLGQ